MLQLACTVVFIPRQILSQSNLYFSRIIQKAPWYGRENAKTHVLSSSLSYDSSIFPSGSIIIYGGSYGSFPPKYLNDVWISSDLLSWLRISDTSSIFPNSYSHCLCSDPINDQLYAIPENRNARTHSGILPIWMTSNLTNWVSLMPSVTSSNSTNPFLDHYDFNCFVDSHSNLYYLLGNNQTGLNWPMYNQVWRSIDSGYTWTQRTDSIPFASRYDAMSGVHVNNTHLDGKDILYILGGTNQTKYYLNDIWISSDGAITWRQIPGSLNFNGYALSNILITRQGLMIINAFSTPRSKLYISFDGGISWPQCSSGVNYGIRFKPGLEIDRNGYLYIFGGWDADTRNYMNDIWKSSISLFDLEALAISCQTSIPTGGIGLQKWPDVPDHWSSSSSSSSSSTSVSSSSRHSSSSAGPTNGSSSSRRSPSSTGSISRSSSSRRASSSTGPISRSSSLPALDSSSSSTGSTPSVDTDDLTGWIALITALILVLSVLGIILYFRYVKRKYGQIRWRCCPYSSTGGTITHRLLQESELQ
jgi:hypothetical protein